MYVRLQLTKEEPVKAQSLRHMNPEDQCFPRVGVSAEDPGRWRRREGEDRRDGSGLVLMWVDFIWLLSFIDRSERYLVKIWRYPMNLSVKLCCQGEFGELSPTLSQGHPGAWAPKCFEAR